MRRVLCLRCCCLNSKWFDISLCLNVFYFISFYFAISAFVYNALKIISTPRVRHFVDHVTINLAIIRVVNAETRFAWVDGKALIVKKVGKWTGGREAKKKTNKKQEQNKMTKKNKSFEINSSHLFLKFCCFLFSYNIYSDL